MRQEQCLEEEKRIFKESIIKWSERWWINYCFDENNKEISDFKNDKKLYYPFFLDKTDNITYEDMTIDFSKTTYNSKMTEYTLKNLTQWKFGKQYYEKNYKKAECLKNNFNLEKIEKIFNSSNSLVSLLYWKHILKPLEYPIFDQRSLRTFKLLGSEKLWIGGVQSGKNMKEFYTNYFKKTIIDEVEKISSNNKVKFLTLRKIDYALFTFDTLVIKKITKEVDVNTKINEKFVIFDFLYINLG